ncbi:MAG: hypothetical protein GX587_09435 [Bacteroidales bacterium]|nr:hypothetical protein [Bacteroidales bacterium]
MFVPWGYIFLLLGTSLDFEMLDESYFYYIRLCDPEEKSLNRKERSVPAKDAKLVSINNITNRFRWD